MLKPLKVLKRVYVMLNVFEQSLNAFEEMSSNNKMKWVFTMIREAFDMHLEACLMHLKRC